MDSLYGAKPKSCPAHYEYCGQCNIFPCLIGEPVTVEYPMPKQTDEMCSCGHPKSEHSRSGACLHEYEPCEFCTCWEYIAEEAKDVQGESPV